MMTISEAQRFEMHLALQRVLGDDVANTLMDHLPPSGWNDLVRMRDVVEMEKHLDGKIDNLETRLNARIDNLEARLDTKIDNLETRMDARFAIVEERLKTIDGRMKVSLTVGLGLVLAMLAIQVQTLLTVATL